MYPADTCSPTRQGMLLKQISFGIRKRKINLGDILRNHFAINRGGEIGKAGISKKTEEAEAEATEVAAHVRK